MLVLLELMKKWLVHSWCCRLLKLLWLLP